MVDFGGAQWAPSPNLWQDRQGQKIQAIVLHGTAGPNAVGWFQKPQSQVSAHYVVEQDGTVTQCVLEKDAAWHAGVVTANSKFYGGPNPNLWTIGIEHTRDKTNTSPITGPQLAASLALVQDVVQRHGKLVLIQHNQIDVGRICPGPGFPLQKFQDAVQQPAQPMPALAAEASDYYFQLGRSVDPTHAIWTECLLPLYTFWKQEAAAGNPLADLIKPGPLAGEEEGATWGGSQPAGVVRLTNREVGVRLDSGGQWLPYQVEL